MTEISRPAFTGGRNIALKLPPHQVDATIAFYRDVLGLATIDEFAPAVVFAFGPNRLWIDVVPALSQAELWLEVRTDDAGRAAKHLAAAGVVRCDAIEPLPDDFDGFWVASPAGTVHLVAADDES